MREKLLFVFGLLIFTSFSLAVPVTDLNLAFVNPPAISGKDLNFQATWAGGDANTLYWRFDSDGNTTVPASNITTVFSDTFNDADVSDWNVISGTWSAAGGNLVETGAGSGQISKYVDGNVYWGGGRYMEVTFDVNAVNVGVSIVDMNRYDVAGSDGYRITTSTPELKIKTVINGVDTDILSITPGVAGNDIVRVRFDTNGLIRYYTNDVEVGSVVDTNWNTFKFVSVDASQNAGLDDINIFLSAGPSIIPSGASQSHTFTTAGSKTIQLTAQNSDGNASTSLVLNVVADSNAPIIQRFDINSVVGFGVAGQLNYALRCTDNASSTIDYNLTNNGVSQYSSSDSNNQTVYLMSKPLMTGTNTVVFRCTDQAGNTTTDSNSFSGASVLFYFVHADTGVGLTGGSEYTAADVNTLKAYSYLLNQYRDMKTLGDVNLNYSGVGDDGIEFTICYTDPAFPCVTIDFDLGALDTNSVPVCFSKLQPFYEQLVYSTQVRAVKIESAVVPCSAGMAYTDFAFEDAFKLSAYTIPNAYNLYYRSVDSNASYTLLSLLAGNFAARHNLDLLILNAVELNPVEISDDVLTAALYCQVADCNVLSVTYKSPEPNSSVTVKVLNGSTVLTSTTATGADANYVTFTWNFTNADVDANFLTLRAEITRANGDTETISKLFSLNGIQGFIDPNLAIILAFSFFFFGFTLVASRYGLGWFGIICVIGALAILSTAPGTQMVLLSQAMFIVIGAVIFFTWKNETAKAI